MRFLETNIRGVWIIEPDFREDSRGRFFRAWCSQELAAHDIEFFPLQANMGLSTSTGTTRGMHYQADPAPEAKLVRCTHGAIFDVTLDLRPDSPTWGQWFGAELTADNGRMLYVPELCAHGYQTLEDHTEMFYMTSQVYTPSSCRGVRVDDPLFHIQWPLAPVALSDQDRNWPLHKGTTPLQSSLSTH